MFKRLLFWAAICFCSGVYSQEETTAYNSIKVVPTLDTISIDSVSLNPDFFRILNSDGVALDKSLYNIDFARARLQFIDTARISNDTLVVQYLKLPDYLTREYSIYDRSRVVGEDISQGSLFQVSDSQRKRFVPFDGLNTSGSITRGITIGNNQNAVVNSALDLQITGKISDKVSLRASIQDTNIPLQEGGYSQKLDEFDQIFIELFSNKWSIRAGDLFLENRTSRFLNFNKKVQGLSGRFEFGSPEAKTTIFASAALVRGQYARSNFIGQEGNQGPYKLTGPNGELYVLVISGSERVYVNGILLKRGESNDYVIDYNAGEITFTSLFPITSEMRINIEYQFSDRNYTRFVTYAGATHEREKWSIGGYLYSENDVKNQPLQQNLSEEQAQVLVEAGDNPELMTAPSAFVDTYSENKILYRKVLVGGVEAFEYSNDETEELYNVRFMFVGNGQGSYKLTNTAAVGRIYEYVSPDGDPTGRDYAPIVRLAAPEKIQIATVMGKYNPGEKTNVDFEFGISNNDLNLFSDIDDTDNTGLAGKINAKQRLYTGKWNVDAYANYQFIQKEFRTIERLFAIEFDRDWNLVNPRGSQSLLISGLNFALPEKGSARYQFEKLDFTESFSGSRHIIDGLFRFSKLSIQTNGSYLQSDGDYATSEFLRNSSYAKYHFGKNWVGATLRHEDNQQRLRETGQLSALSQRFTEYGTFVGRGDSTKVYMEIGLLRRANDSLQNGVLNRVNNSTSYYLKSKLIQNEDTNLALFINYRNLDFEDPAIADEPSLNSRLLYSDRFFDQFASLTTSYETSSGTLPQQEFTYLEVEPGQGIYTWNDYNGNGIQELEEFEVAQFSDQAKYVRIFLPNQTFIKTHQNKFSVAVTLNPINWQSKTGFKKFISHFYNQTSFLIDRKVERNGSNFDLNPFSLGDDLLGLNSGFRNSLFYNRGKQRHSVTYTYLQSRGKNQLSYGSQESSNDSHQIQYSHLIQKSWLTAFAAKTLGSSLYAENTGSGIDSIISRNYNIKGYQLAPKLSYLFSKNASWDVFYEYQLKENRLTDIESLNQHRVGTSFLYANENKITINGEFSLYKNKYVGNVLSPVAYQMLEGLQPGENMTWRLLLQKNLTQFLDININYQGRKSEASKAIHTGSVQLRAFF